MNHRMLVSALFLAALALPAAPAAAGAWSRPDLDLSAGQSFGTDGDPTGGGFAVALAPLWPAGDHARFGVSVFADDIGTSLVEVYDRNSGQDLGTVSTRHRWTWGAAWRGDYDLVRRPRWGSSVSGEWGWWRVEDDVRGTIQSAISAVGVGLGVDARHRLAGTHSVGVNVKYRQLFDPHDSAGRHPWHYASAALEWRWAATAEH